MKSYTDLEQSRKLAEILPIESADMCLNISQWHKNMPPLMTPYSRFKEFFSMETPYFLIPCWSLSALLDVLPEGIIENYYVPNLQKENGKYSIAYGNEELLCVADNPTDACYKMIIKLKDMKLL